MLKGDKIPNIFPEHGGVPCTNHYLSHPSILIKQSAQSSPPKDPLGLRAWGARIAE
jgi:hypothetical protein